MSKNIDEHLLHYPHCSSRAAWPPGATKPHDCDCPLYGEKQAILTDLMSLIPDRRPFPPYGSIEYDYAKERENSGYNQALKEFEAAIKNYIKGE